MNTLEEYYQNCIDNIKDNIYQLNNNSKFNTDQIKLIHKCLTSAHYALGGEYPDKESEDHAVIYGDQLFAKINELIKFLSNDILEDTLIYLDEHRHNFKCSYCS
jgi:hypothetical protein